MRQLHSSYGRVIRNRARETCGSQLMKRLVPFSEVWTLPGILIDKLNFKHGCDKIRLVF